MEDSKSQSKRQPSIAEEQLNRIIGEIIEDLTGRVDYDNLWWATDEDTQENIKSTWKEIVRKHV